MVEQMSGGCTIDLTEDECKGPYHSPSYQYMGVLGESSGQNSPSGCFVTSGYVYFNPHSSSKDCSVNTCLCKLGE